MLVGRSYMKVLSHSSQVVYKRQHGTSQRVNVTRQKVENALWTRPRSHRTVIVPHLLRTG